jgi:4-hydroxy-tetrahydrodipicolinate synthase
MTEPYRPEGILCALATPLKEDGLTVVPSGFRRLVDFVLAGGVSGIVVLGGTGEYTALSFRERERAVASTVECVGGRVPVIAGILSPGVGDALQMAELASAHGITALMILTPYYSRSSDDGLIAWFRLVAERAQLPVILYNIPDRTGINLTPHVIGRLLDVCPLIVGIKECSQDMGQVTQLIHEFSEKLNVLCGEEYFVIPELALGAAGAVLASANVVPRDWVKIAEHVFSGHMAEARTSYRRLFPLLRILFSQTNPGPLKEALTLMGIPMGPPGLPLTKPTKDVRLQLENVLRSLDLIGHGDPECAGLAGDEPGR